MHAGEEVVGLVAEDKRRLLDTAAVLAIALILLWPAFLNGEPFYMADTSSYVRAADAAIHHLTGHNSPWTGEYFRRLSAAVAESGAATNGSAAKPIVLAGRSIYYGMLLYGAQSLGNFWTVAVVQALLVATAIALTIKGIGRVFGSSPGWRSIVAAGVLVSILTPAAYFASYLLPDIFGALALLAFGHLVFLWPQNKPPERAFWAAVLAAGMLFHAANFLLILVLAVAAAGLFHFKKFGISAFGTGTVAAALVVALTGQMIFSLGIRNITGAAPVRPPFVAARLIADGPGYDYLKEHCPQPGLIYCRAAGFKTRISDALLWSTNADEGIFQALTPDEQRLAASQQANFVFDVLRDRPLHVIGSSIGAAFRQATAFNLESFNYTDANIAYFERKIPAPFIDHARRSKAYQKIMPVTAVEWATVVTVLISLLGIFLSLKQSVRRGEGLGPGGRFALALILGVLLNSAICGALSTPKGRYQMRLIWILPLTALALGRVRYGEVRAMGSSGIVPTNTASPN